MLQLERLETNRRLGDIDGIAAAQYELADLDLRQERPAEALERLAESWKLFSRIGRADGIAFVGQFYGPLLASTDPSRALEILRTSRDAFQLLGMTTEVAQTDELIRRPRHVYFTDTSRLPSLSWATRSVGSMTVVQSSCSRMAGPSNVASNGSFSRA